MDPYYPVDDEYIRVLKLILSRGDYRRGRNGITRSVFAERMQFSLRNGHHFPLLTTKRVFWRGVVEELLWFIRGSVDVRELKARNVNIWNGNTTPEFIRDNNIVGIPPNCIGKGYGWQWRSFGATLETDGVNVDDWRLDNRKGGVDQLRNVVELLLNDPQSRRIVLSAWNPQQLSEAVLPPCHTMYQFYVTSGLSCQMYQRSMDIAAGAPFNIASTSLLTLLLARACGLPAIGVTIVSGDTHLYQVHEVAAKNQVQRTPRPPPRVNVRKPLPERNVDAIMDWLTSLSFEDIELVDYDPHPSIAYEMVA